MTHSTVLEAARELHGQGFAILWLYPKEKRPIATKWTKGERQSWDELEKSYRKGYNVGVRTGTPSKIGDKYLACIDVDIKKPEFKVQALSFLKTVTLGTKFPEVRSGSGNGSRHLYCLTVKPFKMLTLAKHPGEWEVCVYSDGRQMVIPPSVHPSGERYRWCDEFDTTRLPICLDFSTVSGEAGSAKDSDSSTILEDFKVEPVELAWLPMGDEVRQGILTGHGVTDRSSFLLRASQALLSAGLSQNEILTALTDPETFIGKASYEHAQTNSRKRAAAWVYRFTLAKVETERDATKVFDTIPDKPRKLDEAEIAAQTESIENEGYKAEDNGFYELGSKGKLNPAYDALLKKFETDHSYRSVADMRTVYLFNGTHFEEITPIEIKAFAEKHFRPTPSSKIRSEFYEKVLVNDVTKRRFFIDSTEGKINFRNGVLDLENGSELLPHSAQYGFRGVLPYDFDPDARCPGFLRWLSGIMLDDRSLINILQEFMGYIVRGGEYRYHKALWLEGTGRNGKSTFIDVMKALIGANNFSTLSIRSLINDKFAGSDLDGKIANFSEETSPQELADSGPFKNLTGDGDISAQKKFGDIYSFRNRAKLVMSYNTIPDLKDLSIGMLSRPIIVPFRKEIGELEQDHDMKRKLFTELPGIFNFALEGFRRLERQNRFTESENSKSALLQIREESCNVYQWIENYVQFTEDTETKLRAGEIYTAYRGREKYAYGISAFGRKLNSHPRIKERFTKNHDGRMYWGLKLL